MSRFRRYEIIEVSPSPSFCINQDIADFALDLLSPPPFPSPFQTFTDFIQIDTTPFHPPSTLLLKHQIQTLKHRVAALEQGFHRLSKVNKPKLGERKYTWTTEIKSPEENGVDQKYKWVAEVKNGTKNGDKNKNYKFTAEIKGKGEKSPITKTYKFEAFSGNASESSDKSDKKGDPKKKFKKSNSTRAVEITDAAPNHGAVVLRQAFSKRVEKIRGKESELSPQDAAALIQMSFRAYLIRRSQALRALRELAIAKTKLKELRALFNNFTYRRRIARDAEECQRFTEKIIVLLLTVDAIEGADVMVRSAKKSMVDELEAMLDVVDPQPAGRSQSMRKRTFDMPDAAIQKELAAGVTQIVQMLEEDASASEDIEA